MALFAVFSEENIFLQANNSQKILILLKFPHEGEPFLCFLNQGGDYR